MASLFLTLLSFLPLNLHTEYIINPNIYRIKWFTILESRFIGNLEPFGLKQFLLSTFSTTGGILCGDFRSERSKILEFPAI